MADAGVVAGEQDPFELALAGDGGLVSSVAGSANVALVLFAGINARLGMPPFEFFQLTQSIPVKKIFLRDHEQVWYQRGVRGAGGSVDQVAEHLAQCIADADVERVVMIGNSMGGYAALLFGLLLEATEVVAFSPQTFLSRGRRAIHQDRRWPDEIAALRSSPTIERGYLDLQKAFRQYSGSTVFHIHYSPESRQDHAHARQLRRCPAVTLHEHPAGGHELAKFLRNSGQLQSIVVESVGSGS